MKEMILNFKPLNKYIAVESPIISDTTDSGIIKSEEMKKNEEAEMDLFLTVIEISDNVTTVSVGDKICVNPKACMGIEIDGVKVLLAHEDTIIGKRITV